MIYPKSENKFNNDFIQSLQEKPIDNQIIAIRDYITKYSLTEGYKEKLENLILVLLGEIHLQDIKKQFSEMRAMKCFEICINEEAEEEDKEYQVFEIGFDTQFNTIGNENKLYLGHCTNTGFWPCYDLFIEINQDQSLDYYLQGLYEIALANAQIAFND